MREARASMRSNPEDALYTCERPTSPINKMRPTSPINKMRYYQLLLWGETSQTYRIQARGPSLKLFDGTDITRTTRSLAKRCRAALWCPSLPKVILKNAAAKCVVNSTKPVTTRSAPELQLARQGLNPVVASLFLRRLRRC